ncbi:MULTISPECIES: prepilin-type N-terminal cleavage/methylation domain-containing protein [unclassified Enterococcus]|nr:MULTISPECIES: prepilin-type N-terminal cleavage/methylation domain-containing protein [unclassified Enterococcus]
MLKNVMKDERGLSLVELLAVVVIMAIIAGIGAVAISNVIQKNREDAGISNVQSLMSSANLYQMSETGDDAIGKKSPAVTAADLETKNYITQIGFLKTGTDVTFHTTSKGNILITVAADTLTAGSKGSKKLDHVNEKEVAELTRDQLWKDGLTGAETAAP